MCNARLRKGHALVETLIALLALAPFLAGIPLLGKQLDVKHKTYDAARYAVWERTVWRNEGGSNRKSDTEIQLEARDRALGHPGARLIPPEALQVRGVSENPLWRDHRRERLLDYEGGVPVSIRNEDHETPVAEGRFLVPGLAHGAQSLDSIASILQAEHLDLNRRAFARTSVRVALVPTVALDADRRTQRERTQAPLVHQAAGAILSDTWSSRDESQLRRRVDRLTTNELVEGLERPGRPIGMLALGKGKALYGEGQYGWDPDLRPRSSDLPVVYISSQ
jgi:hypothetical protein